MRRIFAVSLLMLSAFAFGCGDEEEDITTIKINGYERDFAYDSDLNEYVYVVSSDEDFEIQYDVSGLIQPVGSEKGLLKFNNPGTYKFELLRNEDNYDPYSSVWTTPNFYGSSDTKELLDEEGDTVNVTVSAGDYVGISLGYRGPKYHNEDPECSVKVSKVQ